MALPAAWSKASAKRSSGTRRPTMCSSASCQRSRARSSAATPGEPVLAVGVDAAEDDAILEHRVDADHAAVERHGLLAAVDAEQAGDATAPQAARGCRPSAARHRPPRRPGRSCRAHRAACRVSRRTWRRTPRRPGSPARATRSTPRRLRAGAGSSSASRSRRRRSRAPARAATAVGSRSRVRGAALARRSTSARPARRAARVRPARRSAATPTRRRPRARSRRAA